MIIPSFSLHTCASKIYLCPSHILESKSEWHFSNFPFTSVHLLSTLAKIYSRMWQLPYFPFTPGRPTSTWAKSYSRKWEWFLPYIPYTPVCSKSTWAKSHSREWVTFYLIFLWHLYSQYLPEESHFIESKSETSLYSSFFSPVQPILPAPKSYSRKVKVSNTHLTFLSTPVLAILPGQRISLVLLFYSRLSRPHAREGIKKRN